MVLMKDRPFPKIDRLLSNTSEKADFGIDFETFLRVKR